LPRKGHWVSSFPEREKLMGKKKGKKVEKRGTPGFRKGAAIEGEGGRKGNPKKWKNTKTMSQKRFKEPKKKGSGGGISEEGKYICAGGEDLQVEKKKDEKKGDRIEKKGEE